MKTRFVLYSMAVACLFITTKSFSQNSLTPLDSAMIACFPFSGNATDQSGNNNNGIVNGAVLTADRFSNPNSAYSFNGANQNITVPNFGNLINGQEVSLSFWATSNIYATRSPFIFVPDDPSNRFNVHIYYGNMISNSQTFWDYGSIYTTGRLYIAGSPLPATSTWDHWVFVTSQAGGFQKCYKNGVLQLTKNSSGGYSNAQPKDLLIGGGLGVNSAYLWFDGKLDDIRIYKRVLTQADVTNLYTNNPVCFVCPTAVAPSNITDPLNQVICVGTSATLSAMSSPTVNWYSSASSTLSLGTGTTFVTPTYTAPGTYTVFAKAVTGCTVSNAIALTITVNPSPTVQVSATNSVICLGQPLTLNASGAVNYTWQPGNMTGNSVFVSPSSNASYVVTGVDGNGCANTTTYNVIVSMCDGIITLNGANVAYHLYPNPAKEMVNIELQTQKETEVKIEVMDVKGAVVYKCNATFSKDKKTESIDITAVSKGVYYIKVSSKNEEAKFVKLIKE